MWRRYRFTTLNLAAAALIVAVDWIVPAGTVVGTMLSIPILLTSVRDDVREVWLTSLLVLAGFVVAMIFGAAPIVPPEVWVPNRILTLWTLVMACWLSLRLQQRRLEAEQARDLALRAKELSDLLTALLAHDLRAPLGMAVEALDYVERAPARGEPLDLALVADLKARFRRNLNTISGILQLARTDLEGTGGRGGVDVGRPADLEAELINAAAEVAAHGKELVIDLTGGRMDPTLRVDVHVLRSAVGILIDNAVRYALPGPIRLSIAANDCELQVRIADPGPGLSTTRQDRAVAGGAGLGLQLCRVLVGRAGGRLETLRDGEDGTTIMLALPLLSPSVVPTAGKTK